MARLDPELVRRLVADSLPRMRFDQRERFYPVRAESWLTHTTSAPWDETHEAWEEEWSRTGRASLPPDPHHRGTALCQTDGAGATHKHVAGPPNAADLPLRMAGDPGPDAIGNSEYARDPIPNRELFLDFAGWSNPQRPQNGGDLEYLYAAFSELASALNHSNPWKPIATAPNRPRFAHPQPPSPAVYCEVDWAGAHPRIARQARRGDFPGEDSTDLDRFWQVTYHYLFPAREAAAGQEGLKPLEGQWRAVSLFYPASGNIEWLDEDELRPREPEILDGAKPEWVVMSTGDAGGTGSCDLWRYSETDPTEEPTPGAAHVTVWVCAGSHRFLPKADPGETVIPPGEPWPRLDYEPGSDMEGLGLPALVATAFGTLPSPLEEIVGGAGLVAALSPALLPVLIFLLLLLLLLNLISELWDDDASKNDIPASAEPPMAPGADVGNPMNPPPAPADTRDTAPPGETGWWPTNEGSPKGFDVAYFDVKTICKIKAVLEHDPDLAPPPWWDFTGRWGIVVPEQADAAWVSGTRRTERAGGSWSAVHAKKLLEHFIKVDAPDTP